LEADFALTYNFLCTHIWALGASRGHLCDSVIFLFQILLLLSDTISDVVFTAAAVVRYARRSARNDAATAVGGTYAVWLRN